MANENQFDVVIVGGGVIGCAIAYYLLKADPMISVAIIEMDASYERCSTTLSDGNIRLQFDLKENIQMSLFGLEVLATFTEDMTVGDWSPMIAFRQQGNLFLSTKENKLLAKAGLDLQESLGCQVAWLEPDEIASRFPLFEVDQTAGGTFGELDGTMDPYSVLMGYKKKAIDLGAEYIKEEVASALLAGKQVAGVCLTNGTELAAEYVVNSAGAWCTKFARTAGVNLPVEPVMRNVFVIETQVKPENNYPLTVFPSGLYLIQEQNNRFLISKSFEDDPIGFDFVWNEEKFLDNLWPELVTFVPSFDRLKITGGWAGLYAVNRFDGNALLGEWPECHGFLLANGFSGHGFQQCHAVGRYISELIRGVDHSLDLTILSPGRLLENKPVFEGHGKLV